MIIIYNNFTQNIHVVSRWTPIAGMRVKVQHLLRNSDKLVTILNAFFTLESKVIAFLSCTCYFQATTMVDNLPLACLSMSFCAEFEEDVLSAMDKLERDYAAEKLNCATNVKSNKDGFTAIAPKDDSTKATSCPPINLNTSQRELDCYEEHQYLKNALKHDAVNSRSDQYKTNAVPKTPCSRTTSHRDSVENDIACTWVTPLHNSTPLDTCRKASVCVPKPSRQNGVDKLNVEPLVTTPKVLCSKLNSNVEKTKLFQAVLNPIDDDFDKQLGIDASMITDKKVDSKRQLVDMQESNQHGESSQVNISCWKRCASDCIVNTNCLCCIVNLLLLRLEVCRERHVDK